MAEENEDWLLPHAAQQRADLEEKGLIFAQKYLVFSGVTADPRARELFEHWTRTVRQQRIAPGATVQEYAHFNARREFIETIAAQIEFANKGTSVPKPRTSP